MVSDGEWLSEMVSEMKGKMMSRLFAGNAPDGGVVIGESDEWTLYMNAKFSTDQWLSLKLVTKEKRESKGNFWLGWNGSRFAGGRDIQTLRSHYPHLESMIVEMLDAFGWTPA